MRSSLLRSPLRSARRLLSTPSGVEHSASSVQHVIESNLFTANEAVLRYRPVGHHGAIEAFHTEVPPAARGTGAAGRLCDALFAHAREENLRVLPTCEYVRDRYVPQRLIAEGTADLALRSLDSDTPGLQIEVGFDGVATLRLTDAWRRNPMHEAMLVRMRSWLKERVEEWPEHEPLDDAGDESGDESAAAPAIRCVVIESEGPVFSAGHDFKDFLADDRVAHKRVLEACPWR